MTTPQDPRDPQDRKPADGASTSNGVGAGVGMAGGAAAGAIAGTAAGPIGTAVGAVVGAVVGGLAGNSAEKSINPTEEDTHWREAHAKEPYYSSHYTYDDYGPAYRAGYQRVLNGNGGDWDSARGDLEQRWKDDRQSSRLDWKDAEPAAKAAWERADRIWKQTKQE